MDETIDYLEQEILHYKKQAKAAAEETARATLQIKKLKRTIEEKDRCINKLRIIAKVAVDAVCENTQSV